VIVLPSAVRLLNWRGAQGWKENRRTQAEMSPRWRWYVSFVLLAGLSFYAPAGWQFVGAYLYHHPYFAIQEFVVVTEAPFTEEEVISWSGLSYGGSVWAADPEQTVARLLTYPGIREAEVRREFPQRVHLRIRARRPLAVIVQPLLTYLDGEGEWFRGHPQSKDLDVPYITGLEQQDLETLSAKNAVAGVLPFLILAKKLWVEPVAEVHWDQEHGYTLFLTGRRMAIRCGWEAEAEKFIQVTTVLAHWPVDGPPAELDTRFTNQVVVRPFPNTRDPQVTAARSL
jgi:hypothetical protein